MNGTKSSSSEAWRMVRSYAVTGAQDSSTINRMMLRFRPIAPKPATCPDVPGGLSSSGEIHSSVLPSGRRKRKYVRVRRNTGYTRKKKNVQTVPSSQDHIQEDKDRNDDVLKEKGSTMLLQLLPDERSCDLNRPFELDLARRSTTDHQYHDVVVKDSVTENRDPPTCPIWDYPAGSDSEANNRMLVVQSWVTVESIAGTCITKELMISNDHGDHQMISATDSERVILNLERDTCPGFVSDGSNRVVWVNGAFKKMVTKHQKEEDLEEVEIVVGLVIKERFPSFYSAFTGHVKLQYRVYASGVESYHYSRVVPCDLWRIDGGGFAWRLDVEAALTLGRT